MSSDLVGHIRFERKNRGAKRPFERTLFSKISGLVARYEMEEDFLKRLEDALQDEGTASTKPYPLKAKDTFQGPLFALTGKKEYRTALDIITTAYTPYLFFANSPEEILLSNRLYQLNPHLEPARLAHFHFETLVFLELTKRSIELLINELESLSREMSEYEHDRERVLRRLAQRIGFLYSEDRETFLKNLVRRLQEECRGWLARFFGRKSCRLKPHTLTGRYGIGHAVARHLIRKDLEAIHDSYRQELLEEGRQKLETLHIQVSELRRLVDAIGDLSSEKEPLSLSRMRTGTPSS